MKLLHARLHLTGVLARAREMPMQTSCNFVVDSIATYGDDANQGIRHLETNPERKDVTSAGEAGI